MSIIESLFVMDLEVQTANTATGRYDDTTRSWTNPTTRAVAGWIGPLDASEDQQFRDAQVDRWKCYLPWGDAITAFDRVRVVDTGQVFEVEGPPWPCLDPIGSESHVEATLRMVTG